MGKKWKPAKKGTVDKYAGILCKIFPEFNRLSEEQLDKILDEMRRKGK